MSYEFPDGSEVRYDERTPDEGSTFVSKGMTWHVDSVDLDSTGGYIVRLSPAFRLRASARTNGGS